MPLESQSFSTTSFGDALSLKMQFDQAFSLVPANTPYLQKMAYRLRYQVYCKENNFESGNNFEDGCEVDEYDERSLHTLLYDRYLDSYIGTVRIILPHEQASKQCFPIQTVCRHPFLCGPKAKTAIEISRFSLSKEIRMHRRPGTTPDCDSQRKTLIPFMALGLIQAIVQMSHEHGTNDLFAVMEPALLRLLARFSIYFKPIGPMVEYHGMRQPCYSELDTLLERVRKERIDVWEVITDEGRLVKGLGAATNFSF